MELISKLFLYARQKEYVQFFVVGVAGVCVQLFVTWLFTEFVFGLDRYFWGYMIGLGVTLFFNFILHTVYTFKTKDSHLKRFFVFAAHYVLMIFIQASIVRYLTPRIGLQYYLIVIAIVIFILSNLNFLFFKRFLFKHERGIEHVFSFFKKIPRSIYIIFGVSVLVRLGVLIFLLVHGGQTELLWGDSLRYQELARNVVEGNGYLYKGVPDAYRAPGFPLFFMIIELLRIPLWLASVFQIVVASLVSVFAYVVASRYLKLSSLWAMVVGLVCAVEPLQVYYSVPLLPDIFFTVALLGFVILLVRWLDDPYWRPMMWAGVLLGVSNYIRPAGLYLALFIVLFFACYIWKKKLPTTTYWNLGLFVGMMLLVMFPWYVRNYIQYNEIGFVSAGAYNAYIYAAASTEAIATGQSYDDVRARLVGDIAVQAPDPDNRSSLRNQEYLTTRSKEIVRTYPGAYAQSVILGVNTFLFSGNYHYLLSKYGIISMPERISFSLFLAQHGFTATLKKATNLATTPYFFLAILGKIFWIVVVLGSVVGAWIYRKNSFTIVFLILFLYFCVTIAGVGIGVEARHRYALNPLIFVFFIGIIAHIYDRYIRRRSSVQ